MSFPVGSLVTVGTNPYFEDEETGDPTNPTVVYLAAGLVTYDAFGNRTGPDLSTAMWSFPDTGPESPTIIVQDTSVYSMGAFLANLDTTGTAAGVWEWRMWGTGTVQATFTGSFETTDIYAGWPEPYGYCNLDNVQARINAGSWNVYDPTAWPKAAQVQDFIRFHSAEVDMKLAVFGFKVPLAPVSETAPIMPQVYLILRNIVTELVCGEVERSRHGSQDENEDTDAAFHFGRAATMLGKIETGVINFSQFGVAGPFMMQPDMSKGILVTGQNDTFGNPRRTVDQGGTIFTMDMDVF